MDSPSAGSPAGRLRGHARITSADERRRAMPRRSTRGPLDDPTIDDPLGATSAPSSATGSPRVSSPQPQSLPMRSRLGSPTGGSRSSSAATTAATANGLDSIQKDLSFLRDPTVYHPIPSTAIPAPFLRPRDQTLTLTSPLPTLLSTGHFRLAAVAAARQLTTAAPATPPGRLLSLFHARLACLCLLGLHALAAAEAKALGDLTSAFYRHPLTGAHLVPWDLRVLVVRLTALGYGEWRRGVMGFYELARDARDELARARNPDDRARWRARLRELGVRTAGLMVEMGDLEGAGRCLEGLGRAEGPVARMEEGRRVRGWEALVWLRLGDVRAARRCLAEMGGGEGEETEAEAVLESHESKEKQTLEALILMAEGDLDGAAAAWADLSQQHPDDAMVQQNRAVCLLYTGRIAEARALLESLVQPPGGHHAFAFHALTFNLATVYELCTERARDRKLQLAETVAARGPDETGWERVAADFKL